MFEYLEEIATPTLVRDDEYDGYLYRLKDEYAGDKYWLFLVNIMSTTTHMSTDTMRDLVLIKDEPYLYLSRRYPTVWVLQNILVKYGKDVTIPKLLKKAIDVHASRRGIFYVTDLTIFSQLIRRTISDNMYKLLNSELDIPYFIRQIMVDYAHMSDDVWHYARYHYSTIIDHLNNISDIAVSFANFFKPSAQIKLIYNSGQVGE